MKHYYPAIFRPKGDELPGYDVNVVDIGGCLTMGDDIAEKDYPVPREIPEVDCPAGSFVSFVCFDKELYDANAKINLRRAVSHGSRLVCRRIKAARVGVEFDS